MRSIRHGITYQALVAVVAALPSAGSVRADDVVRSLGVSAGLGYAFPSDDTINGQKVNGSGEGGWFEAEYVERRNEWIAPHIYSGVLITAPDHDCGPTESPCDVSAKIFFLGAKMRLTFPIPYVAPFLESGLGVSVGSIRTRSGGLVDVEYHGVTYHVPVSLGLAVGPNHQYEISFQYLFHPLQRQVNGAVAVGVSFPL